MSKRSPKYKEEELHALVDGCIRRWNILCSNINSDIIVKKKEEAWMEIEEEVNTVNTSGMRRNWQDLRRKFQVERSNVKKKVQEVKRKTVMTGNNIDVPQLTPLENKFASLLVDEEVSGIPGYSPIGLRPTAPVDVMQLAAEETSNSTSQETFSFPTAASVTSNDTSLTDLNQHPTTTSSCNAKKRSTSDIQRENACLMNANLKLQFEVLTMQKRYYTLKLARLESTD